MLVISSAFCMHDHLESSGVMSSNITHPGLLLSFEGGDGVGKTTQIKHLAQALTSGGFEVVCVREPGGTQLGETIRSILLDPSQANMAARTELLLYEAARAQLMHECIAPALERGAVVLCDRFFDSSVAYQSFGRGLPRDQVDYLNLFATAQTAPDCTILLVADSAQEALMRACDGQEPDRLEAAGKDFHERVASGFLSLAQDYPERIHVISANQSRRGVALDIGRAFERSVPKLADMLDSCPLWGLFDE